MVEREFDVLVAGGGLSGVAAAVAAAREGTRVLLVEKYGSLGGMATAALVNPFMPYTVWTGNWQYDWSKVVNRGVFETVLKELVALGGLHKNRATFNEEILKLVLDGLTEKYHINVLFHSLIIGADVENGNVKSIRVANKSGAADYFAKYFVDATGDADLSALCGAAFKMGRDQDGLCQPMTLCFRLAGVDMEKFQAVRPQINKLYQAFQAKGKILNPREDVLIFDHTSDGVLHFNSTRIIQKNPLDAGDLSWAEREARKQVYELYRFMKENIEGFENCTLLMSASQVGVRESRRLEGEYTITLEDLTGATKFEDSIARGTYPADIHNPSGTGTYLQNIPYGDYYTIPYRALLPRGFENLIVAGRPISSTHEAHSAYRVMPICCCIGEGAGAAAAVALKEGVGFKKVEAKKIQNILDQNNALY